MFPRPDTCANKVEQIFSGAATVFQTHGYEGASMSQIATAAHVSKGTLYNYFDTKADLFAGFVRHLSECKMSLLHECVVIDDLECEAALMRIAQTLIRLLLSPAARMLHRIVMAEAQTFPELANIFWENGVGRTQATLAGWIKRQTELGHLRADDPTFAAEQFVLLCQVRIVQRVRLGQPADQSDDAIAVICRRAVSMFLSHYGVRPAV